MIKFLKRLLIFCGLCLLAYPLVILCSVEYLPSWLRPNVQYLENGDGYMQQRLMEADSTRQVDILFLGSSHTYQGYDPISFSGYKIMNLGSSNQTHVQTSFLLDRYLHSFQPKLIVYEVNPNMLYNDDTESTLDIISNLKNVSNITQLIHSDNAIKVIHTLTYKFMKKWLHPTAFSKAQNDAYGDRYISGGFVKKNKGNNNKFSSQEFIHIPTIINQRSLAAFNENVSKIKMTNTPLILVYTPVTKEFYKHSGEEDKIKVILNQHPTIPYINFNELSIWNDTSDFYDEHHLNAQGVKKYNDIIIKEIQTVFNI